MAGPEARRPDADEESGLHIHRDHLDRDRRRRERGDVQRRRRPRLPAAARPARRRGRHRRRPGAQRRASAIDACRIPTTSISATRPTSVRGLVAYTFVITTFARRADEPAQRKVGMTASGNLFDAMEVRPILGRAFRADEDRVPGRDAGGRARSRRVDAAVRAPIPAIVNKRIHIGGVEFTVIGVAPPGFTGHRSRRQAGVLHPAGDVHGGTERRAARRADAA